VTQFLNIPEELRQLPQWVCWRIEQHNGKTTKVPKQPNGVNADSTAPKTWSTFERVAQMNGQFNGIGFVFTKQAGYTGVDFDKCRDPKTAVTEKWALDVLKELDSYTELSQSGEGWHLIVKGTLPADGNRKGRVEMYDSKRFFCMTGALVPGIGCATVEARDIANLQKRMLAGEFGSSPSKEKREKDESAEDWRLIGEVQKQAQTSDPAGLEEAFKKQYPERYAERNRVKRDRAGKSYFRYSIENFLARKQQEPRVTGFGSTREDTSNGERFAAQHHEIARFWHGRNRWMLWSGAHWPDDEVARVVELAKQTARSIYNEAAKLSEEQAAKMGRWAERSLQHDKITAMLNSAKSDPRIAITTDRLDSNPWLLNFENGTVDLRSGELRAHRRNDYITKLVRYKYAQDLNGPRWLLFVEQMFGDLADWVQKAVGYSLTGITSEKVVFLLLGPTDTGKTTFLTTLKTIFADYSSLLQIDTLMWSKNQDNNTSADLADLRGARFVMTSETEEGQRLREAKLKRITQGMGEIKAIRKYENPITFPETHKLWIDANFAPAIRGADDAIWRRLLPIPCNHKAEKKDPELASKLLRQAEAIASWAVTGAIRWHKEGLERPESIEETRDSWKSSMDLIGDFIDECCVVGEGESSGASEIYQAFHEWAKMQGHEHPLTQTVFGTRLSDRGFEKGKRQPGTGRLTYSGIRLR